MVEAAARGAKPLVQVATPVELDLERLDVSPRGAVPLRDMSSGEGIVEAR